MTWQHELQQLDSELAAGTISAEDYRRRRDELLTQGTSGRSEESSSGVPPQGGPPTPSGGTPTPAENASSPFPPAFRWNGPSNETENESANESTQIVPGPLVPPTENADPTPESERTQVVSQQGGFAPPPRWSPPQEAPVRQEQGTSAWMRQGPEVFAPTNNSGKGKRIAGFTVAGVLLAGLIVAGIVYALNSGAPTAAPARPEPAPAAPPPPKPTTTELPEPPAAKPAPANTAEVLVRPEGAPRPGVGPFDLPRLLNENRSLLPEQVVLAAEQNKMSDGVFQGSTVGKIQTAMLALRMPDEKTASTVAETYQTTQGGLDKDKKRSLKGVEVHSTGNGTLRASYVVHSWVVTIEVLDLSKNDKAGAERVFDQLLEKQLNHAPPTVRK